jgi:hypothetical protein
LGQNIGHYYEVLEQFNEKNIKFPYVSNDGFPGGPGETLSQSFYVKK